MILPVALLLMRAMTLDDIQNFERVTTPQLSPDGSRVVYVVSRMELKDNRHNSDLWIVDTKAGSTPKRITFAVKRDDTPRWSPDGKSIAFLSDRDTRVQVFLLPLEGGEGRKITSSETPVQSFAWTPDGKSIVYTAAQAPDAEDEKRKRDGYDEFVVDHNMRYARLWRVAIDAKTADKPVELTKGPLHVLDFAIAPDGKRIAFTARPTPKIADSPQTELYLMDIGGEPQRLTNNNYAESAPRFSPDGKRLAYLSHHGKKSATVGPDAIHVRAADAAPGDAKILQPDFPGYIRDFDWAPDGRSFYLDADQRTRRLVVRIDAEGRRIENATDEQQNVEHSVSQNAAGMAFIHEAPDSPPQVWVQLGAQSPRPVTKHNPQVAELQLGKVETINWKSSKDQKNMEGLLVSPVGYEKGKKYPLVVCIHGGPEGANVRAFTFTHTEFPHVLAGKGYFSFYPNFRGSSNYGQDFAEANAGDAGGGDYQDIMSGVDYLVAQGSIDESRMAVKGWSYGGYMSGWIIGHSNRFKTAVYGAGLSNSISYYGQADIQFSRENLHGGTPWTNAATWIEQSPITYMKNAKTPALIFHGEKDERVPLPQSYETYIALKKFGVPVELVIYPREPHGLSEPKHQVDKMRRELEWLTKYLQ